MKLKLISSTKPQKHKKEINITNSETPFSANSIKNPGENFIMNGTPIDSKISIKIPDEAGRWAGNLYVLQNDQKISLTSTCQKLKYQNPGTILINVQQPLWSVSKN
jgi:hypothetical protein